jgi:hypothetical protein
MKAKVFIIAVSAFLLSAGPAMATPVLVPEPSSMLLVGLGLAGLAGIRKIMK